MRVQPLLAVVLIGGCESEPVPVLTPSVFDAELVVMPSTETPDRICKLVGSDGSLVDLKISGDVAYEASDVAGNWQIVEPDIWSANVVSSRFDVGLGGLSTHRWKTSEGDMFARVEWCDECPLDGADSTVIITDPAGSYFAGVCRPIEAQLSDSSL